MRSRVIPFGVGFSFLFAASCLGVTSQGESLVLALTDNLKIMNFHLSSCMYNAIPRLILSVTHLYSAVMLFKIRLD